MELPSLRVDGKVALVTGTGSGLGKAISIGLARAGADVALTELPDRRPAAEATAKDVEAAGRRALVCPLDVSKVPMIDEAVGAALAHFGRIDILVNNAGINIPRKALDVTEEQWDKILDIDLKGVFFASQSVARKAFVPQGRGKIVNIASQMGVAGYVDRAAYCSAKGGVVNMTRALAFEWAPHKINVNSIGPTFVETPLTRPMFENKDFKEDVLRRIPWGRLGLPEDMVGAVVFLASDASDMMTGQTLVLDGGWTAV